MYGKCIKKDAGIFSQLEIAFVNNTKINLDKNISNKATALRSEMTQK